MWVPVFMDLIYFIPPGLKYIPHILMCLDIFDKLSRLTTVLQHLVKKCLYSCDFSFPSSFRALGGLCFLPINFLSLHAQRYDSSQRSSS